MLAITPFDFIPLEGPLAAIFDLIMMPLLVWLSVKLIPTQVRHAVRWQRDPVGAVERQCAHGRASIRTAPFVLRLAALYQDLCRRTKGSIWTPNFGGCVSLH